MTRKTKQLIDLALTDRCYHREREEEGSGELPLCARFVWLISNDDIFQLDVLGSGDIVGSQHVGFDRLIGFP